MPEVMIGFPMSATTWFMVYGLMWVPVLAIFVILFSVGTGLGENDDATTEEAHAEAAPQHESHSMPHAA